MANATPLDFTDTLQLENILGYIRSRAYIKDTTDPDGFSETLIDLSAPARPKKNDQLSEELQLSGKTDWPSHLVGAIYDKTSQPSGTRFMPHRAGQIGASYPARR